MKEIEIKNTKSNENEYVFTAEKAFFKIPIKENTDKIEFNSEMYKMNKENLIRFDENYLKTQKIKNLVFEGPIKTLFYNEKTSHFKVPDYFNLKNKANNKYFIEFQNAEGIFDSGIFKSNKAFQVNHKDFYLSGDNIDVSNQFNDILITKNSKLIDKKKNSAENLTITSDFLNYFKLKGEVVFRNKVYLIKKDIETESEFLHAFFDEKQKEEIEIAIFKENIVFTHKKNSKIRSQSGYYLKQENVFIFCDNVEVENEKGFSKADFYVYSIDQKNIVNLQEKNKFFLQRIKDIDKNASKSCTEYEEKLTKFIIKNEKSK